MSTVTGCLPPALTGSFELDRTQGFFLKVILFAPGGVIWSSGNGVPLVDGEEVQRLGIDFKGHLLLGALSAACADKECVVDLLGSV